MHKLSNYKQLVESNLIPVVFTEHNAELVKGFNCELMEDYSFHFRDIGQNVNLDYIYKFDENSLRLILTNWNNSAVISKDAYIDVISESIVPEVVGDEIDISKLMKKIDGHSILDLSEFYVKPKIVTNDLLESMELLNSYRCWTVHYTDTNIDIVAPKEAVSVDSAGNVAIVSMDFLNDYLDIIQEQFNTIGVTRDFVTNSGDIVQISGGTFGNKVDVDAELSALQQLFETATSVNNRIPEYKVYNGTIDGCYIEISINNQHVWYYDGGQVVIDSDCVTGNVATRANTPKGCWYLDIVTTNRTLWPKGAKTGSFVNRWMRFTPDGCGLHDATWRNRFGGEIYKTNGSHGCVNLPKDFAYALYEYAYIGLPVIVY